MKKYFYFAAALLTLASCANDDFVGENEEGTNTQKAITLSSGFNVTTRADKKGSEAASALGSNFVVFGNKKVTSGTQTVFDNYNVNWVDNSANTSESNSANWEYVGYTNVVASGTAQTQYIKYWDYSANPYAFFAYSKGGGSATVSVLDGQSSTDLNKGTYTIQGTATDLGKVYVTDHFQINPSSATNTEVDFTFKSLGAQARIGVYETIPGYSIKSIKFYSTSSATAADVDNGTLYTASTLADGGTYTVTFDSKGKTLLSYSNTGTGAATKTSQDFGTFTLDADKADKETSNAADKYLGRSSDNATKTAYANILPNPAGTALTLKVDYTLIAMDGTGETIDVKGATATVPAAYTQWQPNFAYTYLFKISDNTNGQSGTVTGLYPITLDAIVTDATNGDQETITSVAATSVTTYEKGTNVTTNNEYVAGDIYVVVDNGTDLTKGTNAFLYTATASSDVQGITEATVENAIQNGVVSGSTTYTVTDAKSGTLAVTTSDLLSDITEIPAEATVDGVKRTVDGAKFTAVAGTTYVFAYLKTEGTASAASAYDSATTYYKKNAAGYYYAFAVADATAFESAKSELFTAPTQPTYVYKVIKVKEA